MHISGMNMFLIFVDFEDKKVARACREAVEVVEKAAAKFDQHFKSFYVVDDGRFSKVSVGITWDSIPSLAFYS